MDRFTSWLMKFCRRDGWMGMVARRFLGWRNTCRFYLTIRLSYLLRRLRDKWNLARRQGLLYHHQVRREFLRRHKELRAQYGDRVKKGRLEAFAETGTEGFIWEVYEDGKTGYEGLVSLANGDRLIIFHHDGTVAFDGEIDANHETGRQPFPLNPDYSQPVAFGCWIHWTQRGWTAEEWAALFFHGVLITEEHPLLSTESDQVPLRAIVVKRKTDVI